MLPAKYLNGNAVLAIPAYAYSQDKMQIDSKWEKSTKQKTKQTNTELGLKNADKVAV
jgi:hypothetical protein